MNKKVLGIVFVWFFLSSFCASAQPKHGIPDALQRGYASVKAKVGEVGKKVNTAAKKVEESQFGTSIKTGIEKAKAMKESISASIQNAKDQYENIKTTIDENKKAIEGVIAEGQSLYEEGKGAVEGAIETGKNAYETGKSAYETGVGVYEETMAQAQNSRPLSEKTLEKDIQDIKQKMEDRKGVLTDEARARVKLSRENMDALEEIMKSSNDPETRETAAVLMEEAKQMEKQYETDLASLEGDSGFVLEKDTEFQDLKGLLEERLGQLTSLKDDLKQKALGIGSGFIQGLIKKSKQQKKADYAAVGDANFVGPDTPLTDETVKKVKDERVKNVKQDIASALAKVINIRLEDEKNREDIERISDNVSGADYEISAQSLENEQTIQRMKLLHDDLALEISTLKMKTSANMQNQSYRQKNVNKNPGEINMDVYELTEEEIKKRGFGD